MMEVIPAGSVGDVGRLGDKWAFTLYDNNERELLAFVFVEEGEARRTARAMQETLAGVAALAPAEGKRSSFFSVPTRRARNARPRAKRLHRSLRVTPAMAAGVSDRFWTLEELVEQTSR